MKQIHCFLDCIVDSIYSNYDHRPLLLGVWESSFIVENNKITYFSEKLTHDRYLKRFNQMYGDKLIEWYEYYSSKENNFKKLVNLANEEKENQVIIVQLDLYYLPYEPRSFMKKHLPHFILINKQDNKWIINDPYLGFKGQVEEEHIKNSFCNNHLGAGFYLHNYPLKNPDSSIISKVFEEDFKIENNLLIQKSREILSFYSNNLELAKGLQESFSEIGILGKRKISYIAAFELFENKSKLIANNVRQLINGWQHFGFLCIKASMSSNKQENLSKLFNKLSELEMIEKEVKENLWNSYQEWNKRYE
jgi:hypothetical protein